MRHRSCLLLFQESGAETFEAYYQGEDPADRSARRFFPDLFHHLLTSCAPMGRLGLSLERLQSLGLYFGFCPAHIMLHSFAVQVGRQGHPATTNHTSPTYRPRLQSLQHIPEHGSLHAHLLPTVLLSGRQRYNS